MPRKESIVNASTAQAQQESASMGIDAFELPKSVVTKLARAALPDNAKMQKEMLLAVLKGSTVFVNYLAANAHEVASSRQHKSVSASDVLRALEQMDMGDIVPKLQAELEVYRSNQKADKGKKGGARSRAKDADSASAATSSSKAKGKEKAAVPTNNNTREVDFKYADMEEQPNHPPVEDEDEEMQDIEQDDDEGEQDEVEDQDEDDEDGVEGEEVVDAMAIEEEELRRDARGVEEREHDSNELLNYIPLPAGRCVTGSTKAGYGLDVVRSAYCLGLNFADEAEWRRFNMLATTWTETLKRL
ncbi:hypothetical protein NM688_g7069 [Phlebia brevispora]|uniref:Uncharacterized protein n=1 Tax=Phlebia brevispora TaxID=194682 RepID=A0ACC1S9A9_9APHY|nr:hypothetical protein NM688_g7069 [Phlebia brevispora]